MSRLSTVFMFPGQGSQYYQMGADLFARHAGFKAHILRLDAVAKDLLGRSIVELVLDPGRKKADMFDLYSSPAIFVMEYALARCLIEAGVMPDYLLSSSMGAYAAAAIAGATTPEAALRALAAQG